MANAMNMPKTHLILGLSLAPAVMVSVTPMQPGVMPCPARPLSL